MSALDDLLRMRYGVSSKKRRDIAVENQPPTDARPDMMATCYISGGAPLVDAVKATPEPETDVESEIEIEVEIEVGFDPEAAEPYDAMVGLGYGSIELPANVAMGVLDVFVDDVPQQLLYQQPSESVEQVVATVAEPAETPLPAAPQEDLSGEGPKQVDFKPEWEIDAFPWPSICHRIQGHVASGLQKTLESIVQACTARKSNTIALTSARDGAGRTTLSLCIAREAAKQGKTVAIIDLDHEQPAMLQRVGIEFDQGLESLSEERVTAESICVAAVEEGVSLFPAAHAFELGLCAQPQLRELLRTASQNHDLVVIDASREVADLLVGLHGIPSIALIMVDDLKTRQATRAFLDWLHEKDAWTLGVIKNFAA